MQGCWSGQLGGSKRRLNWHVACPLVVLPCHACSLGFTPRKSSACIPPFTPPTPPTHTHTHTPPSHPNPTPVPPPIHPPTPHSPQFQPTTPCSDHETRTLLSFCLTFSSLALMFLLRVLGRTLGDLDRMSTSEAALLKQARAAGCVGRPDAWACPDLDGGLGGGTAEADERALVGVCSPWPGRCRIAPAGAWPRRHNTHRPA